MGKEQLVIMKIYLSRYYSPTFACYKIEAISIKRNHKNAKTWKIGKLGEFIKS